MPIQARAVIPPRVSESDTMSADERTLYNHSSDDESYDGRPSEEVSDADHDLLESEEEREQLLTQKEGFFKKKSVKIGKHDKGDVQRGAKGGKGKKARRGGNGETASLMYEMKEVGARDSNESLESGRRSSESDEQRLKTLAAQRKVRGLVYSCAATRLTGQIDSTEAYTSTSLRLYRHYRRDPCSLVHRLSCIELRAREGGCGCKGNDNGFERHVSVRTNNNLDISRWFPCRLFVPRPYTYVEQVGRRRNITQVHAT